MTFRIRSTLAWFVFLELLAAVPAVGEEGLDAGRYVEIVLRSHPGAGRAAGLEASGSAEARAARLFPDPVFEYSRDRARLTDGSGRRVTEESYSIAQTIPWAGTFSAGIRAADRAADALSAEAEAARWELAATAREAFARLVEARALVEIARAAEADARSLRDLIARRAELGESRESDRIKAKVEWLRQERHLAAAERGADAAEAVLRALAVEPLPRPLFLRPAAREPMPPLDREALAARILERNPRLRAVRAEAERRQALVSAARRARIPDLAVTLFHQKESDKDADGVSLGVRVPLWNANRGEISRAEAARLLSEAEADRVRVDFLAELQARLRDLQVAGDQTALFDREILPAARRGADLVRLTFEQGETSLLDLLDAQRTLREAEREAAEADLALALAVAEVQKLAGPDFDPWRRP